MTNLHYAIALLGTLYIGSLPAHADDISDALQAATDAYAAGDLKGTSDQIGSASRALSSKKTDLIIALLPAAPDGWTRTPSEDFAAGMAMMGGGAGTEVQYAGPDASFTLTVMADNAMIGSMLGMFASPEMMAMMGKVVPVGSVEMIDQGESGLMGILGDRVMITASGASAEVMVPILATTDFEALGKFDQ
jgi:hypothetical protein